MKNIVLRNKLKMWRNKGYSITIEHRKPNHTHVIFKPIDCPNRIETELRLLKIKDKESYFKLIPHCDNDIFFLIKDFEKY